MALYAAMHRITTMRTSGAGALRAEYDVFATKGGRKHRIGSVYSDKHGQWSWVDHRGRHHGTRWVAMRAGEDVAQRTMAQAVWAVAQEWIRVQPEP